MQIEETRNRFEERVFGEYFIKSITRVNDSQFGFRVDCEDMATFCRRSEDGHYVRDDVSAMWFGWSLYHKEFGNG